MPPDSALPDNLPEQARQRLAELARQHGLELIVLFGSRATGVVHSDSDVDVAVRRTAGPLELQPLLDLARSIEEALDVGPVDLVDLARADPLLLRKIFEQGVPLFETRGAFMAARLHAFHRYQDYRPFLRLEREAIRRALTRLATGSRRA